MDLSATIHLLGDLLGQILAEQESQAVFELEENIRQYAKRRRAGEPAAAQALTAEVAALSLPAARAVAAAFTLYFDLINLAEEHFRVSSLRAQQRSSYPQPVPESIGAAVQALKQRGVTPVQMAALLAGLRIEPVLTAHTTEAKRRTVLSKMQRIARELEQLSAGGQLPSEEQALRQLLHAGITTIWLTDRARTASPTVTDEVRTGLYFLDEVLWELLPRLHTELEAALAEHYPGLHAQPGWLRLASWMGGDRDGNPNVTAAVTAETLRLHRGLAVEKHRASLHELARRLSLSARRLPPPQALQAWFESRRPLPAHVTYLEKRYAGEPYRLALSLLADDLGQASRDEMTARLLSAAPSPPMLRLESLCQPLDALQEAVPPALAQAYLAPFRAQLAAFGLHAARLDLREDSARLASALGEILRALKIELDFESAPEADRTRLLAQLLQQPAPALAAHPGITLETAETWALFQLLQRVRSVYGAELVGPFIISMTRGAADVLTVLLLARWAGCAEGLWVAPLFETLADLEAAPAILRELFHLPAYQQHLASCGHEQMVMIGYSDSNKDGGYLAANWALYQAQDRISRTCREHGVTLTLFHGRGGTTARGGGPTNRAIQAQPPGSVSGRLRLTEQGETITSRYSNPHLAHRHLEQIISATLLASAPAAPEALDFPRAWQAALQKMAGAAQGAYRSLVFQTPGFLDYWQSATPLDEIKRLHIGSRPSARQAGADSVLKIRAIPWVFSWMQSRFNLPGWYGLGVGLAAAGSLPLLQEMYQRWPFFSALLDNAEMSLLKADLEIAALYSGLVEDQALAAGIFTRIQQEYQQTRQLVLATTGHQALMDSEPVIQRSIHLRNPYVDPLNYIQVDMLRRLRSLADPESEAAVLLREVIVMTINGIAAGLRNTG